MLASSRAVSIVLVLLTLLNCAGVVWLALVENLATDTRRVALWACAAFGGFSLLSIAGLTKAGRIFRAASELQLTVFSVVLACAFLQVLFGMAPGVFPSIVRSEIEGAPMAAERTRVVDYLPHSPYAKPKPDVVIRIPGYYGPPDTFVYEWRTDRRGYKNAPELAARDQMPIVAVGESFTEGMGVHTDETWTSRLTRLGYVTYNLAVQGYAPIQMAGTFQHFGVALKPKWVIIGNLAEDYVRDRYFDNKDIDTTAPGALPSAIQRLVDEDRALERRIRLDIPEPPANEIRKQYRFVIVALLRHAQRVWDNELEHIPAYLKGGIPDPDNDARFIPKSRLVPNEWIKIGPMVRYKGEFEWALNPKRLTSASQFSSQPNWISALKQYKDIADRARAIGANILIVHFRNRGGLYLKHATGVDVPGGYCDDVEGEELERFARENGIGFIDTKNIFLEAIGRISETTPFNRYPYLPIDGHPSAYGHQLIAEEIARFFAGQGIAKLD
jgi:hypothetical protein